MHETESKIQIKLVKISKKYINEYALKKMLRNFSGNISCLKTRKRRKISLTEQEKFFREYKIVC